MFLAFNLSCTTYFLGILHFLGGRLVFFWGYDIWSVWTDMPRIGLLVQSGCNPIHTFLGTQWYLLLKKHEEDWALNQPASYLITWNPSLIQVV